MSLPGRRIEANGLAFNVVDEGAGTPVLLLHGFPDSSSLWRHQIPALVRAGYRVIAPDLRGFGESSRPDRVEDYQILLPLGDIVAILAALGVERAHVVGHDYGAGLAWLLAALHPALVERLVVLSVGHPASFGQPDLEQREKSWYMLFFQYEDVAEQTLAHDDWSFFRAFVRDHAEADQWIRDLSRPGALTAALRWYRANFAPQPPGQGPPPIPHVSAPTLGIWSSGDAYLTERQMLGSEAHVDGPWRYERIDGASHWLQLDEPERVNALILEFLKATPGGGSRPA